MPTNINNVNKTYALLQTAGGKDEPNIGFDAEIVRDITKRNSERKYT
jgi:dihydroxyacetone kinase DhaKLM complex PTS-EIIA-like component DhaM